MATQQTADTLLGLKQRLGYAIRNLPLWEVRVVETLAALLQRDAALADVLSKHRNIVDSQTSRAGWRRRSP